MATKIVIPSRVVEVLEINYGIEELEEDIAYAKSSE